VNELNYQPLAPKRRTDAARVLLFGVIIGFSTVDFSRFISAGGVTALGAGTLMTCALAWGIWLIKPFLPRDLMSPLLPLVMFEGYALGTLAWYWPGVKGMQLLAVQLGFLAIILLAARETYRDPEMAPRMHTALLYSAIFPVLIYFFTLATQGLAADGGLIKARTFALYAMPVIAVALARWRFNGQIKWLGWALVIVTAVFCSLSRTALIACLILFPLCIALRGDRKSLTTATILLVSATVAFSAAVLMFQPLRDRFFAYDASMKVGGVAFNASGRTKMWNYLLDSLGNDWIFGKGIAASGNFIDDYFPLLGHPHNDYLRFYYDLGVVGLAMWFWFLGAFTLHTLRSLRRSIRLKTPDYPMHLAALMALFAVLISMFTDNSVDYAFVMFPLAITLGCSLGMGRWVWYETQPPPQPLPTFDFNPPVRRVHRSPA
jgi:O-antigen ligase